MSFPEAIARSGSYYGKPNRNIQLTNVTCDDHTNLYACDKILLTPEDSAALDGSVAGVDCQPEKFIVTSSIVPQPTFDVQKQDSSLQFYVVIAILGALLILTIAIIAR